MRRKTRVLSDGKSFFFGDFHAPTVEELQEPGRLLVAMLALPVGLLSVLRRQGVR